MNLLHFDCFSGISGDMVLGALVDLGVPCEIISGAIESLNIGASVTFEKIRKNGFAATLASVEAPIETKPRYLSHIEKILDESCLSSEQKLLANKIFLRLAHAESTAHGIAHDKIHFHEVGAADSIADIVGAAVGLSYLKVDDFSSRSVPTGHGSIKCEHGIMPIPTPGTAALLEGAPVAFVNIAKELTTPTGAAILTTVVSTWIESPPPMTITKIGCGSGTMDFPTQPNILRLFLGQGALKANYDAAWVMETNLDNISAEHIAYCTEILMASGALDVYSIPITMKKGRSGIILGVIATLETLENLQMILFRETGTMGIRKYQVDRTKLERESMIVQTKFGPLSAKKGWFENKFSIITPEYEDCAKAARSHQVSLREVYAEVIRNASL